MAQKQYLTVGDLRGGRNGADAPLSLPETQCVEAMNVDWFTGTLGSKRRGATAVSTTPSDTGSTFLGYLSSLFVASYGYHDYPFAVDSSTPAVVNFWDYETGGWRHVNTGDTIDGYPHEVHAATFNNRTYVCFDSSVNRLHYWSKEADGSVYNFYRAGISAPATAPTATNYGSGSYAATLRYYRVAWVYYSGSTLSCRSELSAILTFTPSGSGESARVARPSGQASESNERFSHWELYGSSDGNIYSLITTVPLAELVYYDTSDPGSYAGDFAPVVGANTPPGSWKYIATAGNRLIGTGNWESGQQSRVWYTPVYGSSDIGDAERVPTSNYIDLDAYDGDAATGLVGSFMGNVLVFKTRQIWRLVPTGDDVTPFSAVCLTKAIGCVAPKSIAIGEDEGGSPAVYFMSHRGPYRLGTNGLEYCGRDVEDVIAGMNQSATVACHAIWHPAKHQVWFSIATGTDNYPTERLVLDTHLCRRGSDGVRGGWSRHSGKSCRARCSMNFGATLSSGARINTQPYVGTTDDAGALMRCDDSGVYLDDDEPFQAYIKTKPYPLGGLGFNCSVGQSHITATAEEGVTITQTIDRDYGIEIRTAYCDLTPTATETRVQRQFEGSEIQGAGVVQFQLGDAVQANNNWTLDALVVPYSKQEER